MNIICMGGRTVGPAVAWDLVQTFLAAEFSQAERHLRRLGKVASLEAGENELRTPVMNAMTTTQNSINCPSTPSARSRWMRSSRPSPDIPARRWRSRRWSTRSGTA